MRQKVLKWIQNLGAFAIGFGVAEFFFSLFNDQSSIFALVFIALAYGWYKFFGMFTNPEIV
jgi:uncharacterized membrane protein YgaE (UPF0421/DUF939 family)